MDYNSFEYLDQGYSRDINAIYFEDKIVEGADPGSFTTKFDDLYCCSRYGHAQDCHTLYKYGFPAEEYYAKQERSNSKWRQQHDKGLKKRYQLSFILSVPFSLIWHILCLPFKNKKTNS